MVNSFFLIHPTKCGGTSISKRILETNGYSQIYCNIFSGYSFNKFLQRNKSLFYFIIHSRGLAGYIFKLFYYLFCVFFYLINLFKQIPFGLSLNGSFQHYTFRQWQKIKTLDQNNIYIATVAHPQNRIVSSYFFLGYNKHYSFIDFIKKIKDGSLINSIKVSPFKKIIQQHLMPITDYLIDEEGNVKIDFLLKKESLNSDWKACCKKFNFSFSELKKINKTRELTDWKDLYKKHPKASEIIKELYVNDFKLLKYKPIS